MTTVTFSHARFRGYDRLAPSVSERIRAGLARLLPRSRPAPDALESPLAGRRWCDATERELLGGSEAAVRFWIKSPARRARPLRRAAGAD